MPKKETKNSIKKHTEAKLQFYIEYLNRYINILLASPWIERVNIYDLYCGAGLYEDGKIGSAIRAVDSIILAIQSRKSQSAATINLHLNDLSKNKTDRIREIISPKSDAVEGFNVSYSNSEAYDLIRRLAIGFQQKRRKTRNLVFIDPYGYKDINQESIGSLMSEGKTEVVLFLPIEQMYRFKGKTTDDEVEKSYIPLKHFIESFSLNADLINSEKEFIKALETALTFGGNYYSASYNIKNHTGHHYGMFFLTSNLLGLEKILEVKWKLDPQEGDGFTGNSQGDFFLETERKDVLKSRIIDLLKQESVDNNKMYEFVLLQGFDTARGKRVLSDLCEEGRIKVIDTVKNKQARKNTFKLKHDDWKAKTPSLIYQIHSGDQQ